MCLCTQSDSFFPAMRLLLPQLDRDREAYGIKEVSVAFFHKVCAIHLCSYTCRYCYNIFLFLLAGQSCHMLSVIKLIWKFMQCHNHFRALFPGPPGWAGARRDLLDFVVQRKINRGRHTDHPAGCHSIQTNQCPPPPSPCSKVEVNASHTRHRALGPELIPVYRQSACRWP